MSRYCLRSPLTYKFLEFWPQMLDFLLRRGLPMLRNYPWILHLHCRRRQLYNLPLRLVYFFEPLCWRHHKLLFVHLRKLELEQFRLYSLSLRLLNRRYLVAELLRFKSEHNFRLGRHSASRQCHLPFEFKCPQLLPQIWEFLHFRGWPIRREYLLILYWQCGARHEPCFQR